VTAAYITEAGVGIWEARPDTRGGEAGKLEFLRDQARLIEEAKSMTRVDSLDV
jgi:hypothetical protein